MPLVSLPLIGGYLSCMVTASQMQIIGFAPISPVATHLLSGENAMEVTSSMWLDMKRCVCVEGS